MKTTYLLEAFSILLVMISSLSHATAPLSAPSPQNAFAPTEPEHEASEPDTLDQFQALMNTVCPISASSDDNGSCCGTYDPDDLYAEPGSEPNPIVERFGPIMVCAGDKAVLLHPALAAEFASSMQIAYCEDSRKFHHYQTKEGLWKPLTSGQTQVLFCEFMKELSQRYSNPSLLHNATAVFARSILSLVQGIAPLKESSAPAAALLPVGNGVLDLSGNEPRLRDYTSEDNFKSKLSVCYDPKATCNRFLEELIRPALPDPDDISLLQRDFGRQLLPGNDAQTFSLITGEGGSGKSVLVSIMERIIGETRVAQMRSDKLNGRFETHGYHGKSTLVGKDVRPDYLSNDGASVVKALTGADRIDTERKYGGKHAIRGCFYLVITSNGRLRINIQDDRKAWSRRLICYPFSREMPAARIPNFDTVLLNEEGPGILNWFVAGLYAHRKELQEHGGFVLTPAQKQRVDDLLMESESERAFLESQIVEVRGSVTVQEIWGAYNTFIQFKKWRVPSKQVFQTRLPELMLELFGVERDNHVMRDGANIRGFKGVMLKSQLLQLTAEASVAVPEQKMAA